MSDPTVPRPAVPDDVPAVTRLARAAYRPYVSLIGRPPAPMEADYGAAVRDGTLWVATGGDRILGLIVLLDGDDHLLLDNVAVDPAAHGRGVGGALLAFAEREARRRGHPRIRLYTNEAMTGNLGWYPRHGYVETHRAEQDGYRRVFFSRELDP